MKFKIQKLVLCCLALCGLAQATVNGWMVDFSQTKSDFENKVLTPMKSTDPYSFFGTIAWLPKTMYCRPLFAYLYYRFSGTLDTFDKNRFNSLTEAAEWLKNNGCSVSIVKDKQDKQILEKKESTAAKAAEAYLENGVLNFLDSKHNKNTYLNYVALQIQKDPKTTYTAPEAMTEAKFPSKDDFYNAFEWKEVKSENFKKGSVLNGTLFETFGLSQKIIDAENKKAEELKKKIELEKKPIPTKTITSPEGEETKPEEIKEKLEKEKELERKKELFKQQQLKELEETRKKLEEEKKKQKELEQQSKIELEKLEEQKKKELELIKLKEQEKKSEEVKPEEKKPLEQIKPQEEKTKIEQVKETEKKKKKSKKEKKKKITPDVLQTQLETLTKDIVKDPEFKKETSEKPLTPVTEVAKEEKKLVRPTFLQTFGLYKDLISKKPTKQKEGLIKKYKNFIKDALPSTTTDYIDEIEDIEKRKAQKEYLIDAIDEISKFEGSDIKIAVLQFKSQNATKLNEFIKEYPKSKLQEINVTQTNKELEEELKKEEERLKKLKELEEQRKQEELKKKQEEKKKQPNQPTQITEPVKKEEIKIEEKKPEQVKTEEQEKTEVKTEEKKPEEQKIEIKEELKIEQVKPTELKKTEEKKELIEFEKFLAEEPVKKEEVKPEQVKQTEVKKEKAITLKLQEPKAGEKKIRLDVLTNPLDQLRTAFENYNKTKTPELKEKLKEANVVVEKTTLFNISQKDILLMNQVAAILADDTTMSDFAEALNAIPPQD